jgi:hypothetical protein
MLRTPPVGMLSFVLVVALATVTNSVELSTTREATSCAGTRYFPSFLLVDPYGLDQLTCAFSEVTSETTNHVGLLEKEIDRSQGSTWPEKCVACKRYVQI